MILSQQTIRESEGLITPFSEKCLQGASYDLRLNRRFCRDLQIQTLSNDQDSLLVHPGEFMILTSVEHLNLPKNMAGHNGLTSKWSKRGLVSLWSPHIDPGFKGILVVPVFNAGPEPLTLRINEPMFTVEFSECQDAPYLWHEKHGVQNDIPEITGPTRIGPHFGQLSEMIGRLDTLEKICSSLTERVASIETQRTSRNEYQTTTRSKVMFWMALAAMLVSLAMFESRTGFIGRLWHLIL